MRDTQLLCGAGKRCVTPLPEMFPFPKNAQGEQFYAAIDDLHVRVLAFESKGVRALLVAFDLGGVPKTNHFLSLLSTHTGIPESNILYFATHTHTAPNVGRPEPNASHTPSEETLRLHGAYLALLEKQMLAAADEALQNLQPVRLGIGYGKSYINVNRNQMFRKRQPDGSVVVECGLGVNPEGPSDKTLFVAKFEDLNGKPIAFLINYAVHAVVMHGNHCFGKDSALSADIPGNVSLLLEQNYPGSVAVWSSGAAGDQNAIMMNKIYLPNPETGERTTLTMAGGDTNILKALAYRHLDDIERVIAGITCKDSAAALTASVAIAAVPGRDVVPVDPAKPGDACTYRYDNAAPYEVRMQLLRLGNLAFVALSGELYTRLGLHLKAISPLADTVLITHCANGYIHDGHMIKSSYIIDDEGMRDGVFGSKRTRMQPGYIKDALANTMLDMFDKAT